MTFKDFEFLSNELLAEVTKMAATKGREYANSDIDRLANFKDIASEIGTGPLVIWSAYFKKHTRSIDNFIKRGSGEVLSESIRSRFVDALTYLLLGYALIVDEHIKREEKK